MIGFAREGVLIPDILPVPTPEVAQRFAAGVYSLGILQRGSVIYRYGDSIGHLIKTKEEWFNMSEDCYLTASEAVERLGLLDLSLTGVGFNLAQGYHSKVAHQTKIQWNTASVRGAFWVQEDITVWFGQASRISWDAVNYFDPKDVSYGRLRKGGRRIIGMPRTRSGGGSQVLVHQTLFHRLNFLKGLTEKLPAR